VLPAQLDHLAYGTPDLLASVRHIHELTGVEPSPGGRHETQATANYLLALGGQSYLEIIGPDPDRTSTPGWFGLAELAEPRLLTWAVRSGDIDGLVASARAAGYDPLDAVDMSRLTPTGETLSWRLTPDTVETTGGLVPFVIDWGTTPHPTTRGLPRLELREFTVTSPYPDELAGLLAALGLEVDLRLGEAHLRCVLDTPNGLVTLD
jgi:hypothetical protein